MNKKEIKDQIDDLYATMPKSGTINNFKDRIVDYIYNEYENYIQELVDEKEELEENQEGFDDAYVRWQGQYDELNKENEQLKKEKCHGYWVGYNFCPQCGDKL
jgi:FtsZ-binding cell division protein ZapB